MSITTEESAKKTLWGSEFEEGHLPELMKLTSGDPTTEELREALKTANLVEHTLRIWISSRNLCSAAARRSV